MSKNLTRKGLAFGAMFALGATSLVAAPAVADTTGPVTLVPTAGTTFNSILQSGITLKSEIDPRVGDDEAGALSFYIYNEDKAPLTVDFQNGVGSLNEFTYEAQADAFSVTPGALTDANRLNGAGAGLLSSSLTTSQPHVLVSGSANQSSRTFTQFVTGVSEVQTVTPTVANATAYVLDLPGEAAVTYTSDADATIGEIASNLNGLVSTATVTTSGASLIITFPASDGNVALATLTRGGVGETVTETTFGTNATNYNFGTTSSATTLSISTSETAEDVTLKVTAFLDEDGDGVLDTFEKRSDEETVILYAPGNVTATTTINSIEVGSDSFKATLSYGNSINPYMVAARSGISILRNGSTFAAEGPNTTSDVFPVDINAASSTGTSSYTKNTLVAGVTASNGNFVADNADLDAVVSAGIYSAVAYYDTKGSSDLDSLTGMVRMGAPSVVQDLTVGASTKVDEMIPVVKDTADQKYLRTTDASEVYVRSGAKTVTFGAQILDGGVVLKDANVEVRAIISGVALDATTTITVSGATGSLVKDGAAITAYARTDSTGRVSFTLTSTTGKENDAVDVLLQFKDSTGLWDTVNDIANDTDGIANGLDIKWFDATLTGFAPKPAAYASGANPTVTFAVTDQWSQPVSFISDERLSVYASAFIGGVEDASIYAERVTVVDGKAAFTFANFAKAGATAELRATLFQGSSTSLQTTSVILYNTSSTDKITVANSFTTDVTYTDYVTGDATDAAVAEALEDTGLDVDTTRATIAGNVLNATGAGQPGVAVTVAADSVLFYDSAQGIYAEDSIVVYANEFGAFSVFAYAHKVNALGETVTITADGVSATTKLVTYLPANELDRDVLSFSWNFPAQLVMNTTYAVTATLTDKWGNPVQTAGATGSVSFVGNGSVQVNGVNTATVKDFDKNGKTTVFVRSIKDIAGPGAVSATLLAVADQYSIDPTVNENGTLGSDTFGSLASNTVNDPATAWNETLFNKTLSVEVDVVESAPATADQKLNAGSFNGYVAVYAKGYKGATLSWKIAGVWFKTTITEDYVVFQRKTAAVGVDVNVELYINGVKPAAFTKTVTTK